jgi:2,3-bisphosphoglycerate-independent phosphoglycerate mutase
MNDQHSPQETNQNGSNQNKVLEIIIDGYGFDCNKEKEILSRVLASLPENVRALFQARASALTGKIGPTRGYTPTADELISALLSPTPVTFLCSGAQITWLTDKENRLIATEKDRLKKALKSAHVDSNFIEGLIQKEANAQHYAIWAARSFFLFQLRQQYPTIITKTSGIAVGYEDVRPEVQGNSETGHQQIGNLIVAMQPPLEISMSINSGEFFQHKQLRACLGKAQTAGSNVDVAILLSGEFGDDGRVHSAWNHLEAFLKLCFGDLGLAPSKVRIQAILDGRDSPPTSSVAREGDRYGFLYKLAELLKKYNAEESLAWVIGRGIGMDRDYDEDKAKTDYLLMTQAQGEKVDGIQGAIDRIKALHAQGHTDPSIPPIVVLDKQGNARKITSGDVFVDLNFRADRQREKIASLLGAKDFLTREAARRSSNWSMDWIDPALKLDICTMTAYHPDFDERYGVHILFPSLPERFNFLEIGCKASQKEGFSFKYLLAAESSKALHVGYFIRGRRESIDVPGCETRTIIPSFSKEVGVKTDDDYYLTPQMKAFEIAGLVADEVYRQYNDLIIVNFANPDMLGHLIVKHYEETVKAIEVIDRVLQLVIPLALESGYTVVLTSDHGNADVFGAEHGANDVLTSFISPQKNITFQNDVKGKARLFDLPWSILDLMGIRKSVRKLMPTPPRSIVDAGLVGRSLIKIK